MNQERVSKALLGPHISEKTMGPASGRGQLVFKVTTDATKLEVKKVVESLFSMKAQRVTTLNVRGRTKRTACGLGKRNDRRKTYIVFQPGQDLDFATSAG